MKRDVTVDVKKRVWSGKVLEQVVYPASSRRGRNAGEPTPRFQTEEERAAHREGIARRNYIRLVNANFGPASIYSTLTFRADEEVNTYQEAKRIRAAFARRLLYRFPDAVFTIVIGRGKHTKRIHMHMISNGIPEESIREIWFYGEVVLPEPLRQRNFVRCGGVLVDLGQDYSALASYLFDHWTPEQGGHHYYFSKNRRQPDAEKPREVKRTYDLKTVPKAPEGYRLTEVFVTKYGLRQYRYVYDKEFKGGRMTLVEQTPLTEESLTGARRFMCVYFRQTATPVL